MICGLQLAKSVKKQRFLLAKSVKYAKDDISEALKAFELIDKACYASLNGQDHLLCLRHREALG